MLAAELDVRIVALAARRSTISARVEALDAALEELGALEAESQRGQLVDAAAERARVIGERLTWAERANAILRRLDPGQ